MPKIVTAELAARMRQLYNDPDEPWTQGRLARHFGFSINTIGRIVRGETHQTDKGVRLNLERDQAAKVKASESRIMALLDPSNPLKKEQPT